MPAPRAPQARYGPASTIGVQTPALENIPPYDASYGDAAIELAKVAHITLDPWQEHCLRHALGTDGRLWTAPTVGLICARQNGKGTILEVLELAHLFLFESRFLVHSAHRLDTSRDHFRRLVELIDGSVELRARLKKRPRFANGQEEIELSTGQRINFRTRAKGGGGRGLRADLLVIDEAYEFQEGAAASLLPTTSARPNPQTWFTSSAVDQRTQPHGITLARIRKAALHGDPTIAWMEWGIEREEFDEELIYSDEYLTRTNPAFGIRITRNTVKAEQARMGARQYAVERLSIGDWPDPDATVERLVTPKQWRKLADPVSSLLDPVTFAFDIQPGRKVSVAVAGKRPDGLAHVDVIRSAEGTAWLAATLKDLLARRRHTGVIANAGALNESVLPELAHHRIQPTLLSAKQYAAACESFHDAICGERVRYPDVPEADDPCVLTKAVSAATKRKVGSDGWAWDRRDELADISGLVAVTCALWGASQAPGEVSYREIALYEEPTPPPTTSNPYYTIRALA